MRVLFLGTPEFAVPSLERLLQWKDCTVVGLVTQPDRPAGRGKLIVAPPTKQLAQKHGIPVLQPEKLSRSPDIVQSMKDLYPDVLVTAAFGQILKQNVLEMAPHGVINVHGSLLPKYRGAAPINWAIINGEKITGITTMFSDPGIDTGDMILKREIQIDQEMDAELLAEQMSHLGAELLIETLEQLNDGTVQRIKQIDDEATYAPRLTKEMGNIDWSKSSAEINNLVRGLAPWPGTYTHLDAQALKIMKTRKVLHDSRKAVPGEVLSCSGKFVVACGADATEALEILEVKPPGKGAMQASAWANGLRMKPGAVLKPQ